jgi:hypothetical protein
VINVGVPVSGARSIFSIALASPFPHAKQSFELARSDRAGPCENRSIVIATTNDPSNQRIRPKSAVASAKEHRNNDFLIALATGALDATL